MKSYTYDYNDEKFFTAVYDLLVAEAGATASLNARDSFIGAFCQVEYPTTEYRFQGNLGFGGKLYRSGGRCWVSCYHENETPERKAVIERVNAELSQLISQFNPNLHKT